MNKIEEFKTKKKKNLIIGLIIWGIITILIVVIYGFKNIIWASLFGLCYVGYYVIYALGLNPQINGLKYMWNGGEEKEDNDDKYFFNSAKDNFCVWFPGVVNEINDNGTTKYISEDEYKNSYLIQKFIFTKKEMDEQDSKEKLQTIIKAIAMKGAVKLDKTTYYEYLEETVSVDFSGEITDKSSNKDLFKGKIILDSDSFYYISAIIKTKYNLENYERFIKSFRLTK